MDAHAPDRQRALAIAAFVVALTVPGCDPGPRAPVAAADARAAASVVLRSHARSSEADVVALRHHLEFGDIEAARAQIASSANAGAEEPLLRARFAALCGQNVEALRGLADERARDPGDPGTYATAAEIYAAADKPDSAWAEIKAGEAACGASAELTRAKGFVWLLRDGGAARALALLEEARAADPTLPFVDRALAQAHLLVGKAAARAQDLAQAAPHAERAVELDPSDVDAQRFLADVLAGAMQFDRAIGILERLRSQGEPLEGEIASLQKRAGVAALLEHDHAGALEHFALARARGLPDAELATGARLLLEEARKRVDSGVQAYERGDSDVAEKEFRAALHFEPDLLQAQNHLAVVLFQRHAIDGHPLAEAIELWRSVVARARAEAIELPEPVHLNLAKAQFQNGDGEGARRTLTEYLERAADRPWSAETRAMLELIPAK